MAYFRGHRAARAEARQPPGTYVALSGGGQAFVPAPLPPKLEWTPDLVAAATEATHLLGRLSGHGMGLPNPHLLIRPFVRREAVLSSRIEGTIHCLDKGKQGAIFLQMETRVGP